MASKEIQRIGALSLADFDQRCRQIVLAMARGIRRDAQGAKVHAKTSYSGVEGGDVVTTADLNAQLLFVRLADRYLPAQIGRIGEEGGLRKPSTFADHEIVMTIDPADGTRALILAINEGRLPRPGEVSVMLGVQIDSAAVGAYICDVGNLTTYARAPYSDRVLSIRPDGAVLDLCTVRRSPSLRSGVLLRHSSRPLRSELSQRLAATAFGRVESRTCSIGMSVMQVFTGELSAVLRSAGTFITPWDDTPVQAMCDQGDVMAFRVEGGSLREVRFSQLSRLTRCETDILYVARQCLPDLRRYASVTTLG